METWTDVDFDKLLLGLDGCHLSDYLERLAVNELLTRKGSLSNEDKDLAVFLATKHHKQLLANFVFVPIPDGDDVRRWFTSNPFELWKLRRWKNGTV